MTVHWPLPATFRLRLTMESDWHVGSGTGRPGNIDNLVVRDGDGLPFVPAKTLRGIWRDACERLAHGLDDGQVGDWSSLVDRIFGSQPALGGNGPTRRHEDPALPPLESALAVGSARLPVGLRNRISADRRFLEAMTFVKPGVKIDRRRGQAETKYLRFEEMARVGTVLEAECMLPAGIESDHRMAASAMLVAAAQLVERLGGKRRRGPGRCTFEVVGADSSQAVAWLEKNENPPAWDDEPNNVIASANSEAAPPSDPWMVVPLVLNLTGPLAVSYRTVGNVVETLDFLPGSYLLPHVTRTLKDLLDVRSAIRSGDLCVLPATLEVDGARGRPVPMALFHEKEDKTKIVNRLLSGESEGRQLKQFRAGYVGAGNGAALRTVPLVVQTHNTVQDGPQRPTTEVGGVYTYEAIASVEKEEGKEGPVRLRSELRLRKSLADRLLADWTAKLNGNISLGRSKKDDYGGVKLEAEAARDFPEAEAARDFASVTASANELFVWLLSDTLLRGEGLRPAPTGKDLAAELARRLGLHADAVKVRETKGGPADKKPLDELVRVRRLDTWHVGWGLPRPSLVALQAGSCLALTVEGKIEPARLREIEASGIGERTAEGYGQVCFNDPLLTFAPKDWTEAGAPKDNSKAGQSDVASLVSAGDPAYAYACWLEREVWKMVIRQAAQTLAANAEWRKETLGWEARGEQGRPSMSQLGGLRSQFALMREASNADQVIHWLHNLAEKEKTRTPKWPSGAIAKAKAVLDNRSWIWVRFDQVLRKMAPIDRQASWTWPTMTVDVAARLQGELWPLAVRTLFDACIRAHKRELESRRSWQEVDHGT